MLGGLPHPRVGNSGRRTAIARPIREPRGMGRADVRHGRSAQNQYTSRSSGPAPYRKVKHACSMEYAMGVRNCTVAVKRYQQCHPVP